MRIGERIPRLAFSSGVETAQSSCTEAGVVCGSLRRGNTHEPHLGTRASNGTRGGDGIVRWRDGG
jgi:hypothetical protein